jgi:hypothetical protein
MPADDERSTPTNLKGWLSDLYFPALLGGQTAPFAQRLGSRATLHEPRFGDAAGLAAIDAQLKKASESLTQLGARYERGQFTTGIDRDVTEGILTIARDGKDVTIPVAVVAERRKSREVELRVYYSTLLITPQNTRHPRLLGADSSIHLGAPVDDYLSAARRGDAAAVLACFEENGVLRDAAGRTYGKANGQLTTYCAKNTPWDAVPGGYADDGRTCALEYSLVRMAGREMPPQAGLAVYERGDSGLIRTVRIYDDVAS